MTKGEYEKKIAELQAQIDELKNEQIEDTPPHPRLVPSNGDTYYVIGTCGDVCFEGWTNDDIDNKRMSCGNIFMTREAAEFAAERRKVLAEMQEWAGNWDDLMVIKYDDNTKKLVCTVFMATRYTYGEMRFATREDAENCIEAVGEDRIKKYYFMIAEGDKNV